MSEYRPRLGDGLHGCYQPPAIKRPRYGVHPLTLVAVAVGASLFLYYVAPLLMVVVKALGERGN